MRSIKENWQQFQKEALSTNIPISMIGTIEQVYYSGVLAGMILLTDAATIKDPQASAERIADLMHEASINLNMKLGSAIEPERPKPFTLPGPKISRNSQCICGSNKKYKNCCLKKVQ